LASKFARDWHCKLNSVDIGEQKRRCCNIPAAFFFYLLGTKGKWLMKECRVCSKLSKSYYCSREHQALWYKEHPRHTKICIACGKEFKTNDPKQEYCCSECVPYQKQGYNNGFESFIERFNMRFGYGFEYVGGYVNCESKVKLRCKTCDDAFEWNAQVVRRKNKKITCVRCAEVARAEKQAAKRDGAKNKQKHRVIKKLILVLKSELKNKERRDRLVSTCKECGNVFEGACIHSCYCSNICRKRAEGRRREIRRRHKLRENGEVDYSINLARLIKRDHNMCHICGKLCDCDDYTFSDAGWFIAGDRYPSIDHVLPVAKGGTHSWGNVKLAHRKCNSMKSDAHPTGLPHMTRGDARRAPRQAVSEASKA
jgi:hypothetical protein